MLHPALALALAHTDIDEQRRAAGRSRASLARAAARSSRIDSRDPRRLRRPISLWVSRARSQPGRRGAARSEDRIEPQAGAVLRRVAGGSERNR